MGAAACLCLAVAFHSEFIELIRGMLAPATAIIDTVVRTLCSLSLSCFHIVSLSRYLAVFHALTSLSFFALYYVSMLGIITSKSRVDKLEHPERV